MSPLHIGLNPSPLQPSLVLRLASCTLIVAAVLVCTCANAQPQPASQRKAVVSKVESDGPLWSSLTPSQKKALQPLENDWNGIDVQRKNKWLEIAGKFGKLSPDQQARVQTRMTEWARLSPRERGQARMNYKEAQQVPLQDRREKWESYNALAPEQRRELADRALPVKRKESGAERVVSPAQTKSNIVPNSSYAARPKAVAPTVSQAQPGVTTNLISKKATPPAHQQTGMPKIAATSGFVDQTTLLPKRGAQGAATRSASVGPSSNPAP
jgi:hypothetical protein